MKQKIIYISAIIVSILFIFIGNKIATKDLNLFDSSQNNFIEAKVISILSVDNQSITQEHTYEQIQFTAKLLSGDRKSEEVKATQTIDPTSMSKNFPATPGEKVLLVYNGEDESGNEIFTYAEKVRTDGIIVLGVIFIILLFIFGRFKGVNTILALGFTVMAIFFVYIPCILSGYNIYVLTIIIGVFITFSTLIIVYGISKKSLATCLGCISGMLISSILVLIMSNALKLTGVTNDESIYLMYLDTSVPIDLKAIVFGAIIIGAIGAIMDVSIDIASSLSEVSSKLKNPTFSEIFKSGMNIGRDIMGTMTNTLILAYIGSSLSTVLLLTAYNNSILNIFNKEMIIIEILQALIGSLGLLFTIPFTSIICSILYSRNKGVKELIEENKINNA